MDKELEIKKRKWEVYAKNCIPIYDCSIDLEKKTLNLINESNNIIYSLEFENWIHDENKLDKQFINLILIQFPKYNIKYIAQDISVLLEELNNIFL